jgi:hypothetical protein
MNTKIKRSLQGLLLVPMLALGVSAAMPVLQPVDVMAATCDPTKGLTEGADCAGDGQKSDLFGTGGVFTDIVNVILFIIGAVSVIMIIFGGFRYVTSGGDSGGVTSAKNTILYAVVGLIVAVLAYAIVNFVLKDALGGTGGSTGGASGVQ